MYGVGTVMINASAFSGVKLALYTPLSKAVLMISPSPGSSMWISPLFNISTTDSITSTPTTSQSFFANNAAVGNPIYP